MKSPESWKYINEKAIVLRQQVFLIDGSLSERLKRVKTNYLLYLFGLETPTPDINKRFAKMHQRWLELEENDFDELQVSKFGEDLLNLISDIENKYWEEKST